MLKRTIYLLIKSIRLALIDKEINKCEKHREKYNFHFKIATELYKKYNETYCPDGERSDNNAE